MSIYASLFIDGRAVQGLGTSLISVVNPATEEVLGQVNPANAEQVKVTLESAQRGQSAWSRMLPWQRCRILRDMALEIRRRQAEIASRLIAETGKPRAEAIAEIQTAADFFDWFADEARRIEGQLLPGRSACSLIETRWEPVGVVLALTAWNFPIVLAARKISMALAAGCSVILRPADEAPSCVALLVECCLAAGLPDGTLNMLLGTPEQVIAPLLESPVIRKVSFTGSTRVGQLLASQCASDLKRLTMELGGHAPVIVMDDVDIESAASLAAAAKYRNAGQVCTSPSRFFVHHAVKSAFVEAFTRHARAIRLGLGDCQDTQMGPLTTARQLAHSERLVSDAVNKGAALLTGGKRPDAFQRGYFFEPTVLDDVPPNADIWTQEPFCPVAAVTGVGSGEEAISRANSIPVGLAGYVFCSSVKNIEFLTRSLECGVIGVNNTAVGFPEAPFGGIKHSGYGREGGSTGLKDFMATKMVHRTW